MTEKDGLIINDENSVEDNKAKENLIEKKSNTESLKEENKTEESSSKEGEEEVLLSGTDLKKFYGIISFVLGALVMAIVLYSVGRIGNSSNSFFTYGDDFKTASNIRMCARNILEGENLWYSFSVCFGSNTSLLLAYDFFSPFNLLYIIFFNADICLITAAVFILKTGTASLTFQVFASKCLKIKNSYSIIFAVFYSSCGFALKHAIYNNFWADALYILPLVALGIYLAVKENRHFLLIVSYILAFITNFYMGYIIGVFSFAFFFLLLFLDSESEKKDYAKKIIKYLISCFVSILTASFVWVPTLYTIIRYSSKESFVHYPIMIDIKDFIVCLFWGVSNSANTMPHINCGVLTLIASFLFFANKKIGYKKKIIAGSLIAFCVLCSLVLPFYTFIHAFDRPAGFDFRFSYVLSFILCSAASLALKDIQEIKIIPLVIFSFVAEVFVFYVGLFAKFDVLYSVGNQKLFMFGNAVLIVLWTFVLIVLKKHKLSALWAFLLITLTLAETISDGYLKEFYNPLINKNVFNSWSYYMSEVANENYVNDFYRINYRNDINANSGSYWGYNSISYFGSNDVDATRITAQKLGLLSGEHVLHSTGVNPFIEILLGVKYNYSGDDLYANVTAVPSPLIKEDNEYYISFGYMVDEEAKDLILEGYNSFENSNLTAEALCKADDIFVSVSPEYLSYSENGLSILETDYGFAFLTEDCEEPSLYFLVDRYNDYPMYIQFEKDTNPFKIYIYIYGMDNLMFLDPVKNDSTLTYSPMIQMSFDDTMNKYFVKLVSYEEEGYVYNLSDINIYYLNNDNLNSVYDSLSKEPFVVEEYKNGYIKGHVDVEGERRLLYLSLPYIDGWTAYVNGQESEIVPVLNRSFIGIELPDKGNYEIELKFKCPYLMTGLCMSLIGMILSVATLYFEIIKPRFSRKSQS